MRSCWNWQTGMTKDHVSTDVRVQVPPTAPAGRACTHFVRNIRVKLKQMLGKEN